MVQYVKEIEVYPSSYYHAIADYTYRLYRLEECEDSLIRTKNHITRCKNKIETISLVIDNMILNEELSVDKNSKEYIIHQLLISLDAQNHDLILHVVAETNLEHQFNRYSDNLNKHRDTILNSVPEVITLSSITESIQNNNIKNKSIKLFYKNNIPTLSYIYTGVLCTPNNNPYENIGITTFPLVDIRAEISLSHDMRFRLLTANSEDRALNPSGYRSSRRPHPHILANDVPCLGDFEGYLYEALSNKDWPTLTTVLQMFLEQSYNEDYAGKHWVKYAIISADNTLIDTISTYRNMTIYDPKTDEHMRIFGKKFDNYKDGVHYYSYEIPVVKTTGVTIIRGKNTRLLIKRIKKLMSK